MSLFRVLFALVLAWCLGGCAVRAEPCEGSFTYDGFDRDRMKSVEERWQRFTGRKLELVEGSSSTCHIYRDDLPDPQDAGKLITVYRNIVIDVATPDDRVEAALLHELGHEAGMNHVHGGGIMADSLAPEPDVPDFNEPDHEECVRAGACD